MVGKTFECSDYIYSIDPRHLKFTWPISCQNCVKITANALICYYMNTSENTRWTFPQKQHVVSALTNQLLASYLRSEVSFKQTLDSRALGNLKRFCRNMASHLLTKYITWCKTCQSLRCSCTYCISLQFLIGQVCSQMCSPYLAVTFGFFELRTFPWSPSRAEVGTF